MQSLNSSCFAVCETETETDKLRVQASHFTAFIQRIGRYLQTCASIILFIVQRKNSTR